MAKEKPPLEDKIKALKSSALFSSLDKNDLAEIARLSVTKKYKKGEIIFSEGDYVDAFYIIVKGRVKIVKFSVEGKEHILHIFARGEPFGEAAIFSGQTFPAHAQAAEEALCLYIQRRDLIALITRHPQLALSLLETLSGRLRKFARIIEDLSLKEVSARLAKYILDLSVKQNNPSTIHLDMKKGELASRLGTISETLSRTLTRLKSQKVISVQGNEVRILDNEKLKKISAGYKS